MSGHYKADKKGSDFVLTQNGAGPKGFSAWTISREQSEHLGPITEMVVRGVLDEHVPGSLIVFVDEFAIDVQMPAPKSNIERTKLRIARQDVIDQVADLFCK